MLAESRRAELRVGVSDLVEDPVEGFTELHGFRRSMRQSGFVDRGPTPIPRVVTEQAGFSVSFIFHRRG